MLQLGVRGVEEAILLSKSFNLKHKFLIGVFKKLNGLFLEGKMLQQVGGERFSSLR
jgi:hypothetical protein